MKESMRTRGKSILSTFIGPVSAKILAIGILTVLLLQPATMIQSLIRERESRQKEVVAEIGSKWGNRQTVTGPIISVPYRTNSNNFLYMHFLPERLDITGLIKPQVLYRGIFQAVVYNAELELTGVFPYPDTDSLKAPRNDIEWDRAVISLGFTDVRGIKDGVSADINRRKVTTNPGLTTKDILTSGVSAPITLDRRDKSYAFNIKLNLNGSERIDFVPLGRSTTVSLTSEWPSPSFDGAYLPVERSVSDTGFSATWKALDLNRDYPQHWRGAKYKQQIERSAFGVGLFTPVDFYQKSMRTTKYAALFISLIFIAFFISELVAKVRVHPVQYLLIGAAIVTFYTMLISLSEHIGFGSAYAVASIAVVTLVTLYAKSILKGTKLAFIVGGVLSVVYGYLYWLLQMADYALVIGSVGLFVVIGVIMYVTRKLDWYAITFRSEPEEEPLRMDLQA